LDQVPSYIVQPDRLALLPQFENWIHFGSLLSLLDCGKTSLLKDQRVCIPSFRQDGGCGRQSETRFLIVWLNIAQSAAIMLRVRKSLTTFDGLCMRACHSLI
jgi:hypothetical protein